MLSLAAGALWSSTADAETRALKLYNTHTKERATIVFKRDGKYDKAGLAKVNHMLRDWRRNEPTKMDPKLIDLVWAAYQKSGSDDYIHIISGYRSPATNNALRKRSKGVAKNSQHMQGKAMDFYIPDVPLAQLRAIGLRLQVGGVGFYPSSGSPFVHMDTGSVRHWPRMNRQQLVKVFPDGKTLHVPSDGRPLPGYAQALAAHKLRGKSGAIEVASAEEDEEEVVSKKSRKSVGAPVVIASVSNDVAEDDFDATPADRIAGIEPPLPRPSPIASAFAAPAPGYDTDGLGQMIVATADPLPTDLQPSVDKPPVIAAYAGDDLAPHHPRPFEFESASHWSSPPVPVALARAMAARDVSRPASLPIRPTAVVATVEVSRPLRAEAITTAVLAKHNGGTIRDVTPVFAYASAMEIAVPPPAPRKTIVTSSDGIPIPVANPLLTAAADPVLPLATGSIEPRAPHRFASEDLTLTALDTLGLRLWIGTESTRQRQYALLTMPDFSQIPSLLDKPELAYSAGFGDLAYQGLRTDRFSGPLVQLPTMIDLSSPARLAFR